MLVFMVAGDRSVDPTAVSVRGLRKTYGERTAVDGIDLDIPRGEVFALLGPNGAGKTTTVEILEGYRRRDAGEVRVLGPRPGGRDAGVALPCRHRPAVGHRPRPSSRSRRRCATSRATTRTRGTPDEVIATVGLTDSATQRVRLLSGGQRRRLDVALGILGRPELLFLDEPTTGFDPVGTAAVLGPRRGPRATRARRSC